MKHIQKFQARNTLSLPLLKQKGWQLKQYAILAMGKVFNDEIANAAQIAAFKRLPHAGNLIDETGNHGVGFQIIHFAETAVVSPVFYWQWGSVLANITQLRASWDKPTQFDDGIQEIIGCVWELAIINFEVNAWQNTVLNDSNPPQERLTAYLAQEY